MSTIQGQQISGARTPGVRTAVAGFVAVLLLAGCGGPATASGGKASSGDMQKALSAVLAATRKAGYDSINGLAWRPATQKKPVWAVTTVNLGKDGGTDALGVFDTGSTRGFRIDGDGPVTEVTEDNANLSGDDMKLDDIDAEQIVKAMAKIDSLAGDWYSTDSYFLTNSPDLVGQAGVSVAHALWDLGSEVKSEGDQFCQYDEREVYVSLADLEVVSDETRHIGDGIPTDVFCVDH